MPKMLYTFRCPVHGEFDRRLDMLEDDLLQAWCPKRLLYVGSNGTSYESTCGEKSPRVFNHYGHYFPDCLWHPDGRKQDPSELPPAPQDHNYGWHGFGESKLHGGK